jgi:hypothetical protein
MEKRIEALFDRWQRRNIRGIYCETKEEAIYKILQIVPKTASVGISGSRTLDELEAVKHLESGGRRVCNQYRQGLSKEESLAIRREGVNADYYLASANAVSQGGELVFFSAFGNRIAGISYAQNTIIVAGVNKITRDLESALKRAREYATPLNCKRLNWDSPCYKDGICREKACLLPEYKRMCCQVLIIEAEVTPDRVTVILVNEKLGF